MLAAAAAASPWLVLTAAGPALALWRQSIPFAVADKAGLPLFGVAIGGALVLMLVAARFTRTTRVLATVGLWLALVAVSFPSGWTIFEADVVLNASVVVVAVAIGLLAACWMIGRRFAKATFVAASAVSVVSLAALLSALTMLPHPSAASTSAAKGSNRPNIYQFVFDGFATEAFPAQQQADAFPGFTFYPKHRVNYVATDASLPSLFTGRVFEGGSFRAFQAEARGGGYRTELAEAGYQVSLYTPDRNRFWWLDAADIPTTAQDLSRATHDPAGWRSLLQTGLIEASPPGVRRLMLLGTRRLWRWSDYNSYKQSLPLFERFLADEASRPARGQYVYFHLMVPHPPYRYGPHCERAKIGYLAQSGCAVTMMRRAVEALRKQGKLQNALVILQGDHGFHAEESDLPPRRENMPAEVRQKLLDINDSFSPDAIVRRTRALLLIHRPGAPLVALKTSGLKTQMIDIAPTVGEVAAVKSAGWIGRSVFTSDAEARDWHFFGGVTSKTGLFRERLGRDTDKGRIAHIVVDRNARWRVAPDVIANGSGTIAGR